MVSVYCSVITLWLRLGDGFDWVKLLHVLKYIVILLQNFIDSKIYSHWKSFFYDEAYFFFQTLKFWNKQISNLKIGLKKVFIRFKCINLSFSMTILKLNKWNLYPFFQLFIYLFYDFYLYKSHMWILLKIWMKCKFIKK